MVRIGKAMGAQVVLTSFVTLASDSYSPRYQARPDQAIDLDAYYPLTSAELGRVYDDYNRAATAVAEEHGVPFIDLASKFPKDPQYFPFDLVHFSPAGNHLLAELMADGLDSNLAGEQ